MKPTENKAVLEREQPPFTILENKIFEDPEITKADLLIYWTLCYHADRRDRTCFPSIGTICTESRSTKPTVLKVLQHLIILGYIKKETRYNEEAPGGRRSNLYTILYIGGGVKSKKDTRGSKKGYLNPGKKGYQELDSSELDSTNKEASASPLSADSKPEDQLPGEDSGSNPGNGHSDPPARRCTDPVIIAYVNEHEAEYGIQPRIPFSKVGKLLKDLRRTYTDEQLVKVVQAARRSGAWFRKGNAFDLATILSSAALNQILRDNPDILGVEKSTKKVSCPECQGEVLGDVCMKCGWSKYYREAEG